VALAHDVGGSGRVLPGQSVLHLPEAVAPVEVVGATSRRAWSVALPTQRSRYRSARLAQAGWFEVIRSGPSHSA
jgi:hypothetical protein